MSYVRKLCLIVFSLVIFSISINVNAGATASQNWINSINFQLQNPSNWDEDGSMLWNSSNAASMAGWGRIPYMYEGHYHMSLTTPADYNYAGYQCVGLVKTVSNLGATSTWRKDGSKLSTSNLPSRGDIIATFSSNGKYYSHTAIVWNANSSGITVIDQNWEENDLENGGKIMIHSINFGGSGVNDAGNYSRVK